MQYFDYIRILVLAILITTVYGKVEVNQYSLRKYTLVHPLPETWEYNQISETQQ